MREVQIRTDVNRAKRIMGAHSGQAADFSPARPGVFPGVPETAQRVSYRRPRAVHARAQTDGSWTTPGIELIAEHRQAQDAAKSVLQRSSRKASARTTRSLRLRRVQRMACARTAFGRPGTTIVRHWCCSGTAAARPFRGATTGRPWFLVGQTNLVTVDLSPSRLGRWGDCARSFPVEEGRVTFTPRSPAFVGGMAFLPRLHAAMREFVTPRTTFHELAIWSATQIDAGGFVNLDFRGNVGHSIAARREDRLYIERDNHRPLGEVDFFTFEPHVREIDGTWGSSVKTSSFSTRTECSKSCSHEQ